MSRHNRRRTRGSHKSASSQSANFQLPSLADPQIPASLFCHVRPRRADMSARHWHNTYLTWQARERKQKEERERLQQEQRRIFGGDSQDGEDEDGLCSRMMEYFGGLDYLES